ncbi:UNVERIFIED_CONTAM: hypothetical protein Slati_3114000 [Sesamum latifolium]|uniref:Uncharacterized protein n=1 Tax=Sesamum latifolium TaxID=2727402 RepID=A0AAW2V0L6_9LAMI
MKRLEKENAQLREAKKEATSHQTQMEKELKRLSKESAEHEEALRKAVEKVVRDYPHSEEDKDFLKAYCASKVDEFKKSDDYQQEVEKVAIPFLEGYPYFLKRYSILLYFSVEEDLDSLLCEVEAEVRGPPLQEQLNP